MFLKSLKQILCKHQYTIVVVDAFAEYEKTILRCVKCRKIIKNTLMKDVYEKCQELAKKKKKTSVVKLIHSYTPSQRRQMVELFKKQD